MSDAIEYARIYIVSLSTIKCFTSDLVKKICGTIAKKLCAGAWWYILRIREVES